MCIRDRSAENHHAVRTAISKGGLLTRALFDAMGAGRDLKLTGAEIDAGVRELMKEGKNADCVVVGVAKKIARELAPSDIIGIKEFERLTKEAYEGLQFRRLNESDVVTEEFGTY